MLWHLNGKQTLHEIARELNVSRNTIKSHTKTIYRKLTALSMAMPSGAGKI